MSSIPRFFPYPALLQMKTDMRAMLARLRCDPRNVCEVRDAVQPGEDTREMDGALLTTLIRTRRRDNAIYSQDMSSILWRIILVRADTPPGGHCLRMFIPRVRIIHSISGKHSLHISRLAHIDTPKK